MRLILLTCATMTAFAANSVLTRMAVDGGHIGPTDFALLRVLSGALVLWLIVLARRTSLPLFRIRRLAGALSLTVYMIGFSLAYITLDAGLGALILFGVVQISMFLHGAVNGAGPSKRQIAGASVAFCGLLLALWPGPGGRADPTGALFMVLAGLGWAAYTIGGRARGDPLAATGANFILCFPALLLISGLPGDATPTGWILAVLCGGLTSGLGYALWYQVLPLLQQSVAAVVQLSVPVIAIAGGAVLLREPVPLIVVLAAVLVLSGIALAATSRSSQAGHSAPRPTDQKPDL